MAIYFLFNYETLFLPFCYICVHSVLPFLLLFYLFTFAEISIQLMFSPVFLFLFLAFFLVSVCFFCETTRGVRLYERSCMCVAGDGAPGVLLLCCSSSPRRPRIFF